VGTGRKSVVSDDATCDTIAASADLANRCGMIPSSGHGSLKADFEPQHPKIGFMIGALAASAHDLLNKKRQS
jgi:hypothetical protein